MKAHLNEKLAMEMLRVVVNVGTREMGLWKALQKLLRASMSLSITTATNMPLCIESTAFAGLEETASARPLNSHPREGNAVD